jgi:polar amino acid transport system permease protein
MKYLLEVSEYLLSGASVSLRVFLVTLALSLPIGILLAILNRINPFFKRIISFYTWFFRGTPLMLQLFFFMYGLPAIGIPVDRMMVAYIGFSINYSAYFTEIVRSGIESIPKDQFESARVMGCKTMTMYRYVIMPQALRNVTPVITNEVITLIKDTALVTVIAISDIMRNVKEIVSRDFTISPFILASIFYLFISFIIVQVFRRIEKKYDYLESS